jgi:hypothetical protein
MKLQSRQLNVGWIYLELSDDYSGESSGEEVTFFFLGALGKEINFGWKREELRSATRPIYDRFATCPTNRLSFSIT